MLLTILGLNIILQSINNQNLSVQTITNRQSSNTKLLFHTIYGRIIIPAPQTLHVTARKLTPVSQPIGHSLRHCRLYIN